MVDSESNFDSVIHGEKYGHYDASQLEKEIAKQELKEKKINKLLAMDSKGVAGMMPPPAPVKMKDVRKIKEPKFKDDVEGVIKSKGGKKKDSEDIQKEQYDQTISQLCNDMTDTLELDHQANREGKPAFRRFKLLSQIDTALRNDNAHSAFIDRCGLMCFHSWLGTMPDGSLPNQKIVMTILQSLDMIDINEEDRAQLKDLEEDLQLYRDECNNQAYEECRQLSGKILDKWYSKRHNITTNYRNFQGKQEAQKQFENLIENEKKRYRRDNASDNSDEEEPKIKKKQKREGMSSDSRTRQTHQMASQFDSQKGRGAEKQQDYFKKMMNGLKKGKRQTKSMKNTMKLVKLDF